MIYSLSTKMIAKATPETEKLQNHDHISRFYLLARPSLAIVVRVVRKRHTHWTLSVLTCAERG